MRELRVLPLIAAMALGTVVFFAGGNDASAQQIRPPAPPNAGYYAPQPPQPNIRSRTTQGGGNFGVPIGIDSPYDAGFFGMARFGWEFESGLTPEVFIGLTILAGDDLSLGGGPHQALFFGGGLRYLIFNRSAFVPFFGAGFQVISYNDVGGIGIGFPLTGGLVIELSNSFALEFGARFTVELPLGRDIAVSVGPLTVEESSVELSLTPFAGFTIYFGADG